MILKISLIFLSGLIIDLLTTLYTRKVADKKLWPATFLSGLITLANFALLTMIIKETHSDSLYHILAYAGGNSLGTYIAMRRESSFGAVALPKEVAQTFPTGDMGKAKF